MESSVALTQYGSFKEEKAIFISPNVSYRKYVSTLSRKQMICRVFAVLTGTGLGAGIGAGVGAAAGAPAGGIGALPGAGIGAGVGGVVGLTISITAVSLWDCKKYITWKLKNTTFFVLEEKLSERLTNSDLICPITLALIKDPVCLPTCMHPFEREALESWIQEQGTCPITRQAVTLDDIHTDIGAFVALKDVCSKIITNSDEYTEFEPKEIEGVTHIKQDCEDQIQLFVEKEHKHLLDQVKTKSISAREFAQRAQELADTVEPEVEEEATEI